MPVAVEETDSFLGNTETLGDQPPQELDGIRGCDPQFELTARGWCDMYTHHLQGPPAGAAVVLQATTPTAAASSASSLHH